MPKTNIDYSNTIIYKIACNDLKITDVYVGHTTQFTKRKNQHKFRCSNQNSPKYNLKIYKTIRDNGDWENWSMIEIEKFACNDSNEALSRERYWYETLQAHLNHQCPNGTPKEYYYHHKEAILQKRKNYYESNVKMIKTKQRVVCECICGENYTTSNKARHFKTLKHLEFVNSLN